MLPLTKLEVVNVHSWYTLRLHYNAVVRVYGKKRIIYKRPSFKIKLFQQ